MTKKRMVMKSSFMMKYYHYSLFVAVIVAILILSGCSSTPKSRTFAGYLAVSPDANPDYEGRASPIVIKIYQLKDAHAFQEADFFSLYDEGETVLGSDLLSIEERELQPGVSYEYSMTLDDNARYIAVVAAFRNIEESQWRIVSKLPEKLFFDFIKKQILQINVAAQSVSAAFIK